MKLPLTFFIILSVAVAAGCANRSDAPTPQQAFESMQRAFEERKWNEAFSYCTPRTQDLILGERIFFAKLRVERDAAQYPEVKRILAAHAIDLDSVPARSNAGAESYRAMLVNLAGNVKDKGKCFAEILEWTRTAQADDVFDPSIIVKLTLHDVKVDGDRATGTTRGIMKDGRTDEDPIVFVRIDGVWLIDYAR